MDDKATRRRRFIGIIQALERTFKTPQWNWVVAGQLLDEIQRTEGYGVLGYPSMTAFYHSYKLPISESRARLYAHSYRFGRDVLQLNEAALSQIAQSRIEAVLRVKIDASNRDVWLYRLRHPRLFPRTELRRLAGQGQYMKNRSAWFPAGVYKLVPIECPRPIPARCLGNIPRQGRVYHTDEGIYVEFG